MSDPIRKALTELVAAASNYVKPRRAVESRQLLLEALDAARAALAATPLAADNFEWSSLYTAVSCMVAKLGRDGAISTDDAAVDLVMDALHRLDAGQFVPGLTPRAALAEQPAEPAPWHNPRADKLRTALREVADTKNLTATPAQFACALQRIASDALTADAMDEPEVQPAEQSSVREPDDDEDVLAEYSRDDGRREWVSVGCWLRRGEVIVHRSAHGIGEKGEA